MACGLFKVKSTLHEVLVWYECVCVSMDRIIIGHWLGACYCQWVPWRQTLVKLESSYIVPIIKCIWTFSLPNFDHFLCLTVLLNTNFTHYRLNGFELASKHFMLIHGTWTCGLTFIPALRSDYISKVWDEITYPLPNFNGCTIEVWEWISNSIPRFIEYMITYPCWN